MIQKIRSYLLDDEENKSSVGIYVLIVLLAPMLGIFFEYRKAKSPYIAAVNSVPIKKSIFRLKLIEQLQLLDRLQSIFGKEKGEEYYRNFVGGQDVQSFVMKQQIMSALLTSYYERFIGPTSMTESYILHKINQKDARNFFVEHFGMFVYELLTSDKISKNKLFDSIGFFDMNAIDSYCQQSIAADAFRKIILSPIESLEKEILRKYTFVPELVQFVTFSTKKKDNPSYEKRNPVKNRVKDSEISLFYHEGVQRGLYKKPFHTDVNVCTYALNKKNEQKNSKKSKSDNKNHIENNLGELRSMINTFEENAKKDDVSLKKYLEENLSKKSFNENVSIDFIAQNDIFSSISLSDEIKRKYFDHLASFFNVDLKERKKVDDFYVLDNDSVYFFENVFVYPVMIKAIDEVKVEIISQIQNERMIANIYEDSDSIRYDLEEEKVPSIEGWTKGILTYDLSKEMKEKKTDDLSKQIMEKIFRGGLREKCSFVLEGDDLITVYFCEKIDYSEKPYVRHRERFSGVEPYIAFLENKAKIEVNKELKFDKL